MPSSIATVVHNQYLQLRLSGEWFSAPSDDSQQFVFSSQTGKSTITVSYEIIDVPTPRLRQVLEKYIEIRMRSEAEAAFPRHLNLRSITFNHRDGGGELVEYRGADDDGKYFCSFFGAVLPNKIVSLYCESPESTAADNQAAFAVAMDGLTF
jgi:hypothetical protein